MNRQGRDINRNFPDRLDCVGVKINILPGGDVGSFGDWTDYARLVVRENKTGKGN